MTPTPSPDWLPADAAAELLGVKPRQLAQRVAQGMIQSQRLPRAPHQRTARVIFSRADIEALKAGTPNNYGRVVPKAEQEDIEACAAQPEPATTAIAIRQPDVSVISRLAQAIRVPPPVKPWLTLAEAAEASGLPTSWLLRNAEYLRALDVRRPGAIHPVWRFRREGLDRIGE